MSLPVSRINANCLICALYPEQRQEVNAVIWDGKVRSPSYRAAGQRAYEHATDTTIDRKVITRHADHIEDSWRDATTDDPAAPKEEPVFAPDYEAITDRAAALGAQAMDHIELELAAGNIEPRELLGIAKMGVTARAQQRATEVDASKPQVMLMAVFGLASGHLKELPESEAIEVYDEGALLKTVQDERKMLEARARG